MEPIDFDGARRFTAVQLRVMRERAAGRHSKVEFLQYQARGRLRNFPKNRPETTNLNHQKASRRVFIGLTHAG